MKIRSIRGRWHKLLSLHYRYCNIQEIIDIVKNKKIAPVTHNVFRIFREIEYKDVRVVIVGQDPYSHLYNAQVVANGITFGTDIPNYIPESLYNIYREILGSYKMAHVLEHIDKEERVRKLNKLFRDNSLLSWVKQGVFLMNTHWTTMLNSPLSNRTIIHKGKGLSWLKFSKLVVNTISRKKQIVFVLLGNEAKLLRSSIEAGNYIIELSHPSKRSYKKGNNPFWESNVFVEINKYLKLNKEPIIVYNK